MNNMNKEIDFVLSLFLDKYPSSSEDTIAFVKNLFEHAYIVGSLNASIEMLEIDNGQVCPRCHTLKKSKEDKEYIKEFNMCLSCDHTLFE